MNACEERKFAAAIECAKSQPGFRRLVVSAANPNVEGSIFDPEAGGWGALALTPIDIAVAEKRAASSILESGISRSWERL
ncbi:MAG: hypothetical protein IPP82_17445 [Xanthomonadales bacterium]|nr:hypothetical protein [Xanthomonadales bacterium]